MQFPTFVYFSHTVFLFTDTPTGSECWFQYRKEQQEIPRFSVPAITKTVPIHDHWAQLVWLLENESLTSYFGMHFLLTTNVQRQYYYTHFADKQTQSLVNQKTAGAWNITQKQIFWPHIHNTYSAMWLA